jgi:hypothetical protein
MLAVHPVIGHRQPATAGPAPPQLCVEDLEHLSRDPAERHLTKRRLDVAARVGLVAAQRVGLDLVDLQPRVHGRAQRGLCLGDALLLNLGGESTEDLLRLLLVGRRLGQVVPLAGDRVRPGIYEHLIGPPAFGYVPARPASVPGAFRPARTILNDTVIDIDQFGRSCSLLEAPESLA